MQTGFGERSGFEIKVGLEPTLVFAAEAASTRPRYNVGLDRMLPACSSASRQRQDHNDHRPVARTYIAIRPFVVAWATTASPSARR